ncbi:hypothetical protein V6Z12_D11G331900 [Gossypium hirsutum]
MLIHYAGKILFKKQKYYSLTLAKNELKRLTQTITQQRIRALVPANQDRDREKKRDFHRLLITRINAIIHGVGISYSYSRLIHNLYKKQLFLNCKILAQIAISNRNCLHTISNEIRK